MRVFDCSKFWGANNDNRFRELGCRVCGRTSWSPVSLPSQSRQLFVFDRLPRGPRLSHARSIRPHGHTVKFLPKQNSLRGRPRWKGDPRGNRGPPSQTNPIKPTCGHQRLAKCRAAAERTPSCQGRSVRHSPVDVSLAPQAAQERTSTNRR